MTDRHTDSHFSELLAERSMTQSVISCGSQKRTWYVMLEINAEGSNAHTEFSP